MGKVDCQSGRGQCIHETVGQVVQCDFVYFLDVAVMTCLSSYLIMCCCYEEYFMF